MNRSFHIVGSAVQCAKKRISNCDNVTYSPPLRSTYKRTCIDNQVEGQLYDSAETTIDAGICQNGNIQARHDASLKHIPASDQCPGGFSNLSLDATLEDWEARKYRDHILRVNRKKRISGQLVGGRILSGSRHDILPTQITQKPVTSSISYSLLKRWVSTRPFSVSTSLPAVLKNFEADPNVDDQSTSQSEDLSARKMGIRKQLQLWEVAHPVQIISDSANENLLSSISYTAYDDFKTFDEGAAENEFDDPIQLTFEKGEPVDLSNQRPFLRRGDMVELRTSSGFGIELAIFVRLIGQQSQYYTMSGKWIHQKSQRAKFCVPGFVGAHELDPLLSFLPENSVKEALQDKLQSFEHALPREVGSPLIKKMLDFWKESDKTYREATFKLDNAHRLVAHKSNLKCATLLQLANELLPKRLSTNGVFPATALYALHRSLMLDDIGFRPLNWRDRTVGQFEISSINDAETIKVVSDDVRKYQAYLIDSAQGVKSPSVARFLRFLRKACRLIQESRKTRKYTTHGTIGPAIPVGESNASVSNPEPSNRHLEKSFDGIDQQYIRFIMSWVAFRTIQNRSHLHGVASAILRATGMYEDPILDQRVGWTFLQEIGVIARWDSRAQFDIRLFQISQVTPSGEPNWELSAIGVDALEGLRRDWGNLPVYCIDDIGAREIDDGVSIEPTNSPDEYWIHIHAADPASGIAPRSAIAQGAESVMRSIYLPEGTIDMLPRHLVQKCFSLAPGRPCLTFSARVNFKGELLDKKITSGVVRNVMYMTPATLSAAIGETSIIDETVIDVGDYKAMSAADSHRQLLKWQEITEIDKRNLTLLQALGNARQSLSAEKGSLMLNSPSFQMSVTLDGGWMWGEQNTSISLQHHTDPGIRLSAVKWDPEKSRADGNIVMSLMLLAGEVAARWCHERGIPIINRVSHLNPDDPDPRRYFHRAIMPLINCAKESHFGQQIATWKGKTSVALPSVETLSCQVLEENMIASRPFNAFKTLPLNIIQEYQRLLGAVVPSTVAGPHFHLGLDMFARVTSPLRRYEDLLTHWQIEAALLEEARSGQSLIGSTREDYLPFKRSELDHFIPHLDYRERALTVSQRDTQRAWAIQLLVRAWKFNQALLPSAFELVIKAIGIGGSKNRIRGELILFGGLNAVFDLPGWLREEDIQLGDLFEVRLTDLDVYERRIQVEPLRRLKAATMRT